MELRNPLAVALASVALLWAGTPSAEPVIVRHVEGLVHGFLSLRSSEGGLLANGDLTQDARGDRVTSRLVFHFKDGSLHDETAVFSQRGHFQLISDHLVQKGPAFKQPLDMTIDRPTGVGGEFPIVPQRCPNELACGHSGRNSRARIRVAHSTLGHSGTEHTAPLDRSTHIATFEVAWAPAARTHPHAAIGV